MTFLEGLSEDAEVYIVYPLNVTLSDGTQQTINSEEEFYELYESCESSDGDVVDCFTLNFPLTALDSKGNEVTVNSEQELYSLDLVDFAYPISVTLLDGSVVTVNSSDEFDSLYNDCYGIDDCEDCDTTCFEIVFPFSVASQSGDLVTFSDYDQLLDFLDQLTENDTFVIQYPISVEFEDGTQQSVGSDEELEALYEICE